MENDDRLIMWGSTRAMIDMSRISMNKERGRQRSFQCIDPELRSIYRECSPLVKDAG